MLSAKDIIIKPISSKNAANLIKRYHYSGKIVGNSQLHFGVFINDRCEGAMSFGPSLDKRKTMGLVDGTSWNGFIELNRMAFSPLLPKNSESRAISVAIRLIKKYYPEKEWIISFSDGTQCGDGTIYRASGFYLTSIKKNDQIIEFPDGLRETRLVLTDSRRPRRIELAKRYGAEIGGECSLKPFLLIGAKPILGFQLRYIYFLNPEAKKRLTVPILPYSKIKELGAEMYLGKPRASSVESGTSVDQTERGGESPTDALHLNLNP